MAALLQEAMMFDFGTWKSRDYPCVLSGGKVAETQEALEETMMNLNTMNAGELSASCQLWIGGCI